MENLSTSFTTFENKVKHDLKQMETKVKIDMDRMLSRIEAVEFALASGTIPEGAEGRFTDLKKQVEALQAEKMTSSTENSRACNGVFGNFKGGDGPAAENWLRDELEKVSISKDFNIYWKGKFDGMLWVTFSSTSIRNMVLESIRKKGKDNWKCEGATIWSRPDESTEERVLGNTLFGIKFLLHSWGYPRNGLWVDLPSKTIFCGSERVAVTSIENDELVVKYGVGWDSWELFQKDTEMKNMIAVQRAKLSKAKQAKGKGKEKGKFKGEGKGDQ